MGFFKKLFGKKIAAKGGQAKQKFFEKDNMGTRQDTLSLATSYWAVRMSSPKKDPFVLYTFENEKDAREALLELPCIHVAEDTEKLISSEVLIYGYYPTEEGKYEAILCGGELSHELWNAAKDSFTRHNGQCRNDLEPEQTAPKPKKPTKAQKGKVIFVREERQEKMGHTMIYRIHSGPNAASAKAFLENNPVTKQLYYLIVETPEGNYCRDIQGIYKE